MIDSKWTDAIAERISDEWSGKSEFPEDAELLKTILRDLFLKSPESCTQLIGTGIIEENYFENI
ncbi:MAG: hypothetical protein HZA77_05350 [Candidatus Schekmanbacteria bacterium]|nr:hypothetical protein [Candidatus Schekmanbacteria bacterium]